jgi:hypothetical protein
MNSDRTQLPSQTTFYALSWALVVYTVAIVLWGAWVRISGSGDGCGDHWPLCNGHIVPSSVPTKTWVEFLHRLSTGLYGILILVQLAMARRRFEPHHPARTWSALTLLFTITEALIGRQLVTMGLVNESVALARVVVMPLHLVNTALLLGSTIMTAEAIKYGHIPRVDLSSTARRLLSILIGVFLILLTTGAVAALGTHLTPSLARSAPAFGITRTTYSLGSPGKIERSRSISVFAQAVRPLDCHTARGRSPRHLYAADFSANVAQNNAPTHGECPHRYDDTLYLSHATPLEGIDSLRAERPACRPWVIRENKIYSFFPE